MTVTLVYYADPSTPRKLGSFVSDFKRASDEATNAGDRAGRAQLRRLWFDHLETVLHNKTTVQLDRYLGARAPWRSEDEWRVYKTADTPCVAYTAQVNDDDSITLIALGTCYRYPNDDDETWWKRKIRPRLRSL